MIHPAKLAIAESQAVLFDFDGVILDTEWPIYETWRDLFQREHHPLPPEIYVNVSAVILTPGHRKNI